MQPVSRLALVLFSLSLVGATAASAGSPILDMVGPVAGSKAPPSNAPTAPAATVQGQRALPPGSTLPGAMPLKAPLTPEQKALEAIREESRVQVQTLVARMAGIPDGPARYDLMRQIAEIKMQSEVRCLETMIAFARARGDFAAAQQIETVLERTLHPVLRPVPQVEQTPVKGGAQ